MGSTSIMLRRLVPIPFIHNSKLAKNSSLFAGRPFSFLASYFFQADLLNSMLPSPSIIGRGERDKGKNTLDLLSQLEKDPEVAEP